MGEPDDEVLLVVSLPITGQWGTVEELHSRHDLGRRRSARAREVVHGLWVGGG
jgi:hypothetical protein